MSDIRLSICMPTYNFGKFIGQALESVTGQIQEGVEIVVLDGGSTDNTPEVVQSFQRRFPRLFYHRREKRGGIDRDMAETVGLARGEYCWLFSSDDLMKENTIVQILKEIDLGFDLYLCGLTLCTLDMQPMWDHRILNIDSDSEFDLGDPQDRLRYFKLAETTTAFFSFMGSLIFKKSRWDKIPLDEAFVGSLWAHVARILRMIPDGLRLKYLSQSYLDKRGDNDSFMDKGLVHRYMLAVEGYHRLGKIFFGEESLEAFHIRRVIRNEFPAIRALLNLKLKIKDSGKREDMVLLDQLAAKVYKDASLLNWLYFIIYRTMPLPALKAVKVFYRAIKPYLHTGRV